MMRGRRHVVGGGVVLAAAIAGPAVAQMPPSSVLVEKAQRQEVQEKRRVTGELKANRRSQVATQEGGLVVELPVEEGHRVKTGDVLARLDSRRLEIRKNELEADDLAIAAIIEERNATVAWRRRDLELYQKSFDRGAANPKELFDAQSEFDIAQARARQAERQQQVIKARAELVVERIGDMTITAPFDGVVVVKDIELGEWIDEGGTVVGMLSTAELEVWLEVPQRFYAAVAARDEAVELRIDATGQSLSVADRRIIPLVDPRARSFYLVAMVKGDKAKGLAPGMSVTAWVPTGDCVQRLTVSRDAILRNEAGPYVYAARGGGGEAPANAMAVAVTELFPVGDRVVVESRALNEGDLVVIEGNERLFPMMPVIPIVQDADADDTAAESRGSQGP